MIPDMWRAVLNKLTSVKTLLRNIFAIDDSPHAVALGVAVGKFVGLTPTVGIQTIIVLTLRVITRPFFYFNAAAGVASTYISNPVTMIPMYYFWYRLGLRLMPGATGAKSVDFEALLNFEGLSGWWNAMCGLGVQVGVPTCVGALATAPIGAVIAYVGTLYGLKRIHGRKAHETASEDAETSADNSEPLNRVDEADSAEPAGTHRSTDSVSESDVNDSMMLST